MNRWTEESKKEAIELLKSNINIGEISRKFNMSEASIRLLKYTIADNNERIECAVCHAKLKQVTVKHLLTHSMSLDEYKSKFPNNPLFTDKRARAYKSFKSPHKGKTYDDIYGLEESIIKRDKISKKLIGRDCPRLAGTGITGTRRDTNTFARSTYEANVDRIFILNNKAYIDELTIGENRFELIRDNGEKITYCPDRIDSDGLFEKGAYLEIKGYMYPEDWEKICLFRKQYLDKKLLVISSDESYCDVNYSVLKNKYRDNIPLWEDEKKNYKTRPDLYQIGYETPEHIKFFQDNYPLHINANIKEPHLVFIANKCLSFNRVSLGQDPYIDSIELLFITNRRANATKRSSGEYNYELWEIMTTDKKIYYVTNQSKTSLFYCYEEDKYNELALFFANNVTPGLKYGMKSEKTHEYISTKLWELADDHKKKILQLINDKMKHKGINGAETVLAIELIKSNKSRNGAFNNYEEWRVDCLGGKSQYILTNFGDATSEFRLVNVYVEEN